MELTTMPLIKNAFEFLGRAAMENSFAAVAMMIFIAGAAAAQNPKGNSCDRILLEGMVNHYSVSMVAYDA